MKFAMRSLRQSGCMSFMARTSAVYSRYLFMSSMTSSNNCSNSCNSGNDGCDSTSSVSIQERQQQQQQQEQKPTTTQTCLDSNAPSLTSDLLASAFLAELLQPQETIALEDATRTYRTMDVVEPPVVYDPTLPNITSSALLQSGNNNNKSRYEQQQQEQHVEYVNEIKMHSHTPIKDAHERNELWQVFVTATAEEKARNAPPAWFEQLCRDLYFRTDSCSKTNPSNNDKKDDEDADDKGGNVNQPNNLDAAARESDPLLEQQVMTAYRQRNYRKMPHEEVVNNNTNINYKEEEEEEEKVERSTIPTRAETIAEVDPYLWLSFDLLDVQEYHIAPYIFPPTSTYTPEQKGKLCLNAPNKEYVHFCNTYAFPERWQIPTSLGTVPSKLYVDPSCSIPVIYLQLSEHFPPAMWLPIKPTAQAVRRVLSEFAQFATLHRNWHHGVFEERYHTAERIIRLQRMAPPSSEEHVEETTTRSRSGTTTLKSAEMESTILRYMAYDARNAEYVFAPLREFRNQQDFFLGEYDEPEKLLEHLDLCPFTFAIQHLRTVATLHAEHMIPTIDGPGVAPSLYRCIYSKALIFVTVLLSAEVKLPPQDIESFKFLWKDSQVMPKMKVPVFARVLWPENDKMCGGGLLARRLNEKFDLEFAPDIPIDAVMALFYTMNWAAQLPHLLGVGKMRQRVAELEAAIHHLPPNNLLYPGTREIPNPEYTLPERLGMHVQYLSYLNDPDIAQTIQNLLPAAPAAVRMGCAKAALIAGERELFRYIVSSEPAGRMQTYMTKLVRKRKTRDLTDVEPRLLDDQYEFATPLWTARKGRIDRNTLEGELTAKQLREKRKKKFN